jgi:hypothetical protein
MKVAEDRPAESRPRGKSPRRKVRVPQNAGLVRFFLHPVGKTLLIALACIIVVGIGVFAHF